MRLARFFKYLLEIDLAGHHLEVALLTLELYGQFSTLMTTIL